MKGSDGVLLFGTMNWWVTFILVSQAFICTTPWDQYLRVGCVYQRVCLHSYNDHDDHHIAKGGKLFLLMKGLYIHKDMCLHSTLTLPNIHSQA